MIFGQPDSTLLASSSTSSPLTAIPFSSFKFNTIGKEPDLLRRFSAPNPDKDYFHDDDGPSRSSSSSPNLEDQLLLPDHPDSRSRPTLLQSLADRIGNFDVDMTDASPITDQDQSTNPSLKPSDKLLDPSNSSRPKISSIDRGQPKLSEPVDSVSAQSKQLIDISTTAHNDSPQLALNYPRLTPSIAAVNNELSFAALRALHARLLSALLSLSPPNTSNVLILAQSAKTKSAAVSSSAHRAHVLSQQSLSCAQEAISAAQDCLRAAEEAQERAEAAMAAVESMGSGYELAGLKNDLNALGEWVTKREADEAGHQLHTQREEAVAVVAEEAVIPPRDRGKLRVGFDKSRSTRHPVIVHPREKSVAGPTVEEEADAAAKAWNQEREQSAERRKFAEEELRKRREAEGALEQERLRAQAEADAHEANLAKLRAERMKAEEEEQARQWREAQEIERRQREVEAIRKEAAMFAIRQQKAQDERVKEEQEAKRKAAEAEKDKEARLLLEHEQKRKEIHEREERMKQNEAERMKGNEAEEARQQQLRQEQDVKRQQVQAQKHLATQQAALKIIAEREKQKLGQSTSASPPSEMQQTPVLSAAATPPLSPTPTEFGNIVSKKTLTASPNVQVKSKITARVISGGTKLGTKPQQRLPSPIHPPSAVLPTSNLDSHPTLAAQNPSDSNDIAPAPILQPSTPTSASGPDNVEQAAGLNNALPHTPTIKRSPTPESAAGYALCGKDSEARGFPSHGSDPHSLPSLKHISEQPPTPPLPSPTSSASLIQLKPAIISVHREGTDPGNLPIVPPSRTGPISPEAHHTNLRFLDVHSRRGNNIVNASANPVKTEPVPDQLPPPDSASPPEKVAPQQADVGPPRMQKDWSLHKPSQPQKAESTVDAPPSTSASAMSQPAQKTHPPLPVRPKQNPPSYKKTPVVNKPVAEPTSTTSLAPPRVVKPVSTKPIIGSTALQPTRYPISTSTVAVDIYDAFSTQMGPDVAETDGWSRRDGLDELIEEVTTRSPVRDRQWRPMDHYLPPSDNVAYSRAPPQRRVSDHYSPPPSGNVYIPTTRWRTPDPRWDRPASPGASRGWGTSPPPDASRGWGKTPPPGVSRGRGGTPPPPGASRGRSGTPPPPNPYRDWVTPAPPLYPAVAPVSRADTPPLIGRKRPRDDELPAAPRYEYEHDNRDREEREYTSFPRVPPMPSTNENDWSRSAVYGRSPSPDFRPGLASRLAPGPREWESNVYAIGKGESYRPSYSATIGEAPTYSKRPRITRKTEQQKQPPSLPPQTWDGDITRAPANTNKTRSSKNQNRPPVDPDAGGSLPGLLSRFSDSADPTATSTRPPPNKPTRNRQNGRGRGGTPQSLEQRISSKPSSLMHRLESPQGYS